MKFVCFEGMTNNSLTRKVNNFLQSNPHIKVIETKFSASFGSVYVGIFYAEM